MVNFESYVTVCNLSLILQDIDAVCMGASCNVDMHTLSMGMIICCQSTRKHPQLIKNIMFDVFNKSVHIREFKNI